MPLLKIRASTTIMMMMMGRETQRHDNFGGDQLDGEKRTWLAGERVRLVVTDWLPNRLTGQELKPFHEIWKVSLLASLQFSTRAWRYRHSREVLSSSSFSSAALPPPKLPSNQPTNQSRQEDHHSVVWRVWMWMCFLPDECEFCCCWALLVWRIFLERLF